MNPRHRMFIRMYAAQDGNCAICGNHVPIDEMTRDHVVPRGRGGGKNWDNIRLVDASCHAKRHEEERI